MKFASAFFTLALGDSSDVRVIGGYTPPAHRENYILSLQVQNFYKSYLQF
jgi:hypothetical protein